MAEMVRELDGLQPVDDEFESSGDEAASSMTKEEFNAENKPGGSNKKKSKKPWSKKKKIWVIVIAVILIIVLGAGLGVGIWLLTGKSKNAAFDQTPFYLVMKDYYYGTEGSWDKSLAAGKNLIEIPGAVNVSTYEDMFAKLKEGKDVVVHSKTEFVMTEELGSINLKSDLYGNGIEIDAYNVVGGSLGNYGNNAININKETEDDAVLLRDVHIYGKKLDGTENLKTFTAYGSIVEIHGTETNKANAKIFHSIFENSHKVVHLISANVEMEGCMVRNAADTAISIGTFPNEKTNFTSRNNIVASSLTGGILMYNYTTVTSSQDNADTWNNLMIEGFLDIYNWKNTKELAFLPDTELGGNASLINSINELLQGTIVKDEYKFMRIDDTVTYKDEDGNNVQETIAYVHFGILKICTTQDKNGVQKNKSRIYIEGEEMIDENTTIGFKNQTFPLPTLGAAYMKELYVTGLFSNDETRVKHNSIVSDNAKFYQESIGIAVKK